RQPRATSHCHTTRRALTNVHQLPRGSEYRRLPSIQRLRLGVFARPSCWLGTGCISLSPGPWLAASCSTCFSRVLTFVLFGPIRHSYKTKSLQRGARIGGCTSNQRKRFGGETRGVYRLKSSSPDEPSNPVQEGGTHNARVKAGGSSCPVSQHYNGGSRGIKHRRGRGSGVCPLRPPVPHGRRARELGARHRAGYRGGSGGGIRSAEDAGQTCEDDLATGAGGQGEGARHFRADAVGVLHAEIQQPARPQRAGAEDRGEFLHVAVVQKAAVEKAQDGQEDEQAAHPGGGFPEMAEATEMALEVDQDGTRIAEYAPVGRRFLHVAGGAEEGVALAETHSKAHGWRRRRWRWRAGRATPIDEQQQRWTRPRRRGGLPRQQLSAPSSAAKEAAAAPT
ncbi:unnamed protein product, partial [Scytosiphon promiscuus]